MRKINALFSSIYSRVVLIIALLSLFILAAYSVIFKTVKEQYLSTVIHQNGINVASIIEGALFHSMLDNDKSKLIGTLDVINTLNGIDEVNLYNEYDSLVYSSFSSDAQHYNQSDCILCHTRLSNLFPNEGKSFRIISVESACSMYKTDNSMRYLLIRSPIMNQTSCYTASCHAHGKDDTILGSLIIKLPLNEFDQTVSLITRRYFTMAILATLLFSILLLLFTWKNIKKPLSALVDASSAVSSGKTDTRLEIQAGQTEEIRLVSQAFNQMLDKLQTAKMEIENWSKQLEYKVQRKSEELSSVQNELIQIERIASLGKLSASVAHELNNPLSGILVYSKLIVKQLQYTEFDPQRKEAIMRHLNFIESETKRCGDIVKGLLDFSRKDTADYGPNRLNEILASTADLMRHQLKISGIAFYTRFDATKDVIRCSPNQIKQACLAMLVNAFEAILPGTGGEITIVSLNPDENHIQFDISDTGQGMNKEIIAHIFEPFFSTKHEASGIGLGLAIVHGIITSHNGKIKVASEPGVGTTFSITLPLSANK
jgi:two-component system NtrC family sensor kinase